MTGAPLVDVIFSEGCDTRPLCASRPVARADPGQVTCCGRAGSRPVGLGATHLGPCQVVSENAGTSARSARTGRSPSPVRRRPLLRRGRPAASRRCWSCLMRSKLSRMRMLRTTTAPVTMMRFFVRPINRHDPRRMSAGRGVLQGRERSLGRGAASLGPAPSNRRVRVFLAGLQRDGHRHRDRSLPAAPGRGARW